MENWLDEVKQVYNHFFAHNDRIKLKLSDFAKYCYYHTSVLSWEYPPKSYKVNTHWGRDDRDDLFFDFLYELHQDIEKFVHERFMSILDESSFIDFSSLCLSMMNREATLKWLKAQEYRQISIESGYPIAREEDDHEENFMIQMNPDQDRIRDTDEIVINTKR